MIKTKDVTLEVGIGVGFTESGNVGWVMTPEFEAQVFACIERDGTDDEIYDEIRSARKAAGIKVEEKRAWP